MREKAAAEHNNKFNAGDFVRVAIPDTANAFLKKSLPGFSAEVFQVKTVRDTLPHTYVVQDSIGRPVEGHFSESHLLKAEPDFKNWRQVDKVIKTKLSSVDNEPEYLVTFRGYPPAYRRWLSQKQFEFLKKPFPDRA